MKRLLIFICPTLFLLGACSNNSNSQLPTAQETLISSPSHDAQIRKDARIMLKAYAAKDFEKSFKYWHPIFTGLMSVYGGLETCVRTCMDGLKKEMEKHPEMGPLKVRSYSVSGPVKIYQTKTNKYAVFPTQLVVENKLVRSVSVSYYLGHYVPSQGWRYIPIDMVEKGFGLRTFFPDFPKGAEPPGSAQTVYERKTGKVLLNEKN